MPTPDDGRTVGVVAHHIAVGVATGRGWLGGVIQGEPVPAFEVDALPALNAADAQHHAGITSAQVLEELETEMGRFVSDVRALTDADLDRIATFDVVGRRWTAAELIGLTMGHTQGHLKSIQAALADRA